MDANKAVVTKFNRESYSCRTRACVYIHCAELILGLSTVEQL